MKRIPVIIAAWILAGIAIATEAWILASVTPPPAWASEAAQSQPAAASSPAILLEKAIYTEQTLGDLDAAIELYRRIVDEARTNRSYAAQAQFRLAMCYLKKGRSAQAIKSFKELIASFPNQKELLAKAHEQIVKATEAMSDAEIAKVVRDAVTDISTMADGDSRIPGLLDSLRELPEPAVVKAVAKYFDSDRNTVRRAAIYVFWKAEFADASPAVPGLAGLCSHKEDLTRGMAALALGELKAASAFGQLIEMTTDDKSPFARRCGAYALGLMGDQRARPTLTKALKDSNKMVRNNAEAALTMLEKMVPAQTGPPRLPDEVMTHIVGEHLKAAGVAMQKHLGLNTHIYGVTPTGMLYHGGFMGYHNSSAAPDAGPIHLGNFGREKPEFVLVDEAGRTQEYKVRHRPGATLGKWALWWKPQQPVAPGASRLLGYMRKEAKALPQFDGFAHLTMDNTFGQPVLENFFLVVPMGMAPIDPTAKPTSFDAVGQFGIYLWQKQVSGDKPNRVKLKLKVFGDTQPSSADAKAAENLAAEGWKLWSQRKLPEAEDKFKAAVAKDPSNANAWNGLGWAQFNQGKPLNAREAFEKAVKLDPKQAAALNGLGWIAKGRGNTDEAIRHWRRAIEVAPMTTAALNGLAEALCEKGQYEEAMRQYQAWLKIEPGSTDAKAGLNKAVYASKSVRAAVSAAQQWLKWIDAGKYGQSWDHMCRLAQSAVTRAQWIKDASMLAPLGKLESRKVSSTTYATTLPGVPDGQYVTIQYASSFANKQKAAETVTLAKEGDGTWKVAGYFAR